MKAVYDEHIAAGGDPLMAAMADARKASMTAHQHLEAMRMQGARANALRSLIADLERLDRLASIQTYVIHEEDDLF